MGWDEIRDSGSGGLGGGVKVDGGVRGRGDGIKLGRDDRTIARVGVKEKIPVWAGNVISALNVYFFH